MNAHINHFQQLDLHRVGLGLHLICIVAVAEYLKRVAEAAKAGLGEDVVRLLEVVVAGDADGFGKLARDVDLNRLPSDDDLVGRFKGVDFILENDEVTFILNS